MPPSSSPRARRPALALAATLGALAAVAVGCGESEGGTIPSGAAQDIVAGLEEVEQGVDSSACTDVRESSLPDLRQEIEDLPENVDPEVRATLEDGLGRLAELVRAECQEPADPVPTEPEITPEPEPEPDPVPTPDPEPEPEPTQPETPTVPDGGGDGGGNGGNGNGGNGNGGNGTGNGGNGGGGGDEGGGDSGSLPPGNDGAGDPTGGGADSGSAEFGAAQEPA